MKIVAMIGSPTIVVAQRIERLPGDLRSQQLLVPRRDVLHIRLNASGSHPWPLVGEPPLTAAMMHVAMSDAFAAQQVNFLKNPARRLPC
jgi:phage portal protein BeeE